MKRLLAITITLMLCGCASVPDTTAGTSRFLMSYFYGQDSGARLALSNDGIHWKPINGGAPVIRPRSGDIIRDPSIIRSKDGLYHMVWTTGWTGHDIGYASSQRKLLISCGWPCQTGNKGPGKYLHLPDEPPNFSMDELKGTEGINRVTAPVA
jgi:hypothetical protein